MKFNYKRKLKIIIISYLLLLTCATFSFAQDNVKIEEVIIAKGQSLSTTIVPIKDYKYFQIIMPSSWTTANLTFQTSDTSTGTFQDVYDENNTEVVVQAASSRNIILTTSGLYLISSKFLKIRSGTTGTPVNQTSQRTIKLILKK